MQNLKKIVTFWHLTFKPENRFIIIHPISRTNHTYYQLNQHWKISPMICLIKDGASIKKDIIICLFRIYKTWCDFRLMIFKLTLLRIPDKEVNLEWSSDSKSSSENKEYCPDFVKCLWKPWLLCATQNSSMMHYQILLTPSPGINA